ncbi:MAG TPA: IucA/IucC family siderophore biosynthesis protein [Actinophytocola sp.]|uniref:IucA/IucC family protein n=1 Tax=Actinophytocola sp. TaxID=1872138 RepID=UPI002DDCC2E9|nr:IucA/IucC family siderophore biosynthesis protein [Actinophytocola sp.]HEV2781564.1 IucA/IucC family siderophore biosynthesis protein [Actinophytocola sp.]
MTDEHWPVACRSLVAKMLAELSFEQALRPEPLGGSRYGIRLGATSYAFTARQSTMDSWIVAPGTVTRDGEPADDPFRLLLDLHGAWGLDPQTTALTVTELTATLAADAHLLRTGLGVAELADLPHAELEGHQTGHPWIFANKGRVGFSAADRRAYAPEARRLHRLPWIAVHPDLAEFHGDPALVDRELDPRTRAEFAAHDPGGYVWLPVHPWQWDEVVEPLYAAELAAGRIVPLGEAPDRYRAQQSIRTFVNVDRPDRFDVKLPLSILNTMVYRGIPTELAEAAPPSTRWLHAIRDADPFLRDTCRVILPGEVAAVAVRHPVLARIDGVPYRYTQLLGALWREPLAPQLEPGERARTLAALLHVDPAGGSLAAELVRRSGLAADAWLRRLLAAFLPPILHYLYRYGLAFNPHGENTVVIFDERDVPVRVAVKDFVDDMKLLTSDLPGYAGLPDAARSVLIRVSADEMCASLVKSIFVCVFRYLAPLFADKLGVPETDFWAMVRAEILAYHRRFPALADRFALFDLLAPTFERVCLNRERLLPGGYHDRAERDAPFHLDAEPLPNPLLEP